MMEESNTNQSYVCARNTGGSSPSLSYFVYVSPFLSNSPLHCHKCLFEFFKFLVFLDKHRPLRLDRPLPLGGGVSRRSSFASKAPVAGVWAWGPCNQGVRAEFGDEDEDSGLRTVWRLRHRLLVLLPVPRPPRALRPPPLRLHPRLVGMPRKTVGGGKHGPSRTDGRRTADPSHPNL